MMGKKNPLDVHVWLNKRNSRMVQAAEITAAVPSKLKSAFYTLAVEAYMAAHPMGVNLEELQEVQRMTDRSYDPKAPITGNLNNIPARPPAAPQPAPVQIPTPPSVEEDDDTNAILDRAFEVF